jgi:hypothetical protein
MRNSLSAFLLARLHPPGAGWPPAVRLPSWAAAPWSPSLMLSPLRRRCRRPRPPPSSIPHRRLRPLSRCQARPGRVRSSSCRRHLPRSRKCRARVPRVVTSGSRATGPGGTTATSGWRVTGKSLRAPAPSGSRRAGNRGQDGTVPKTKTARIFRAVCQAATGRRAVLSVIGFTSAPPRGCS